MAKGKKRKPQKPRPAPRRDDEPKVFQEVNPDAYNYEMALLRRIAESHRHANDGNRALGMNDIAHLFVDQAYDLSKWPAVNRNGNPLLQYREMAEKMVKRYMDSLVSDPDNPFMPLTDLRKLPMVNLMKAYEEPQDPMFPQPLKTITDDGLRRKYFKYGWTMLLPMLNEFVVRASSQRYVHVKTLAIDPDGRSFTVQLVTYLGTSFEYSVLSRLVLEVRRDPEAPDGKNVLDDLVGESPIEVMCTMSVPYETIMDMQVKKVGFTKEEANFWYDLFGIGPSDEGCIVEVALADPETGGFEDETQRIFVHRASDLDVIRRCRYVQIRNITPHERSNFELESKMIGPEVWNLLSICFITNMMVLGDDGGKTVQKALYDIARSHGGKYETELCVFTSKKPLMVRVPKEERP